jgi:hypothetical protein
MALYGYLASERDNCVSLSRSNPELLAEDSCTESSVDYLNTSRGVVLSRAATILRSIETQPSTGRFVRSLGTTYVHPLMHDSSWFCRTLDHSF